MKHESNEPGDQQPATTRLFSCYVPKSDTGAECDSVMLVEMLGEEINTISLRVASDAMKRWVRRC